MCILYGWPLFILYDQQWQIIGTLYKEDYCPTFSFSFTYLSVLIVLALNTEKIFLLTHRVNYRVHNLPHIQEKQKMRAHNPLHKQAEITTGYFSSSHMGTWRNTEKIILLLLLTLETQAGHKIICIITMHPTQARNDPQTQDTQNTDIKFSLYRTK